MISRGPHGQANAIGGTPHTIASVMTIPNPSKREDRTNIELSQYFSMIFRTLCSNIQVLPISNVSICFWSFSRIPSPYMRNIQSGCFWDTIFHADIRRSNPFCGIYLPTAITCFLLQSECDSGINERGL